LRKTTEHTGRATNLCKEIATSTTPAFTLLPQGIWNTEVASMPETAADWLLPGFDPGLRICRMDGEFPVQKRLATEAK
jgi:hypothetical protein